MTQQPLPFQIPPSGAPAGPEWVFPSAYGGACKSLNPPQIHGLMRKLRIEVGAIAAKKSTEQYGPKFPVRGAKDLNQKLADALNALDMTAPVVAQEITFIDADRVPQNQNKSGNPVFRTLCHVKATVRLTAPDTSFIDVVGSGHGGDVDDKSGGKASTYAWKDAILKGLTVPHEDMVDTDDASTAGEEGPSPKPVARKARGSKAASGTDSGLAGTVVSAPDASEAGMVVRDSSEASAEGGGSGAAAVSAMVQKAQTVEELEAIRANIKTGVLYLTDAEKLVVSRVYTARMKEVKGE